MNRRPLLPIGFGLSIALASATALGDPPNHPRATAPDDRYSYEFSDEILQAGGFGPTDPRIVVIPHGVRSTLIRPRTSFVVELYKSVENL